MSIKDDYFKWYRENYQKLKPTEKAEADKEVSNWKWHDKLEEIILNDPKYDKEKWKYALDHMYWRDAWLALADDDEIVAEDYTIYEYLGYLKKYRQDFKVEYQNSTDGDIEYKDTLEIADDNRRFKPNLQHCMKLNRYFHLPDGTILTVSTQWVSLLAWVSNYTDDIKTKVRYICDIRMGKIDERKEDLRFKLKYNEDGLTMEEWQYLGHEKTISVKKKPDFDIITVPYSQGNPWNNELR